MEVVHKITTLPAAAGSQSRKEKTAGRSDVRREVGERADGRREVGELDESDMLKNLLGVGDDDLNLMLNSAQDAAKLLGV